jgi:uncharacterized 2Fe-2S/4Fe-4S cluster protein (DUF4445 family)
MTSLTLHPKKNDKMSNPESEKSLDDVGPFGLSVDIGTTWVTIHVVEIRKKRAVLEKVFQNPQSVAGLDVVTRIRYAMKSEFSSHWLTSAIRDSIDAGVHEALRDSGISPESVSSVVLVGNTVMHHLFFGLPLDSLVRFPYTAEAKDPISTSTASLGLHLGKGTICYSPPVIDSYIGPDAVAVLLASGLLSSAGPSMAIDLGTNTEILLRADRVVSVASAASGPAFEGMTTECGMSGVDGAILRVRINPTDLRPLVEVLGEEKPSGICGTGIVSALAGMLRVHILDSVGSITRDVDSIWLPKNAGTTSYLLCQATESATGQPIYVSQPDVRLVQQSKAAIYAAINVVLESCSLSSKEIQTVYLTGSFGSHLDLEDAYRIGLFPEFTHARVNQVPGGASIGADTMVASPVARKKVEKAVRSIRYLELVGNPEFETTYAKAQMFPNES